MGWVSHAGTGPVDLAIITATLPDANTAAFVGPVMSYYEYTTTGFQRLTDEEWESTYLSLATRPDWTNSYLADSSGELRVIEADPNLPGDLGSDHNVDIVDFATFAPAWLTRDGDVQ